jgi:cation diffusion facilitator family transporter
MSQPRTSSDDHGHYKTGQRIAAVGMGVSAVLSFIKITGGIISGSASLAADGVESGSDVLSSAILYGGMAIARRPADEKFPYGYGRAESIAGKATGTILLMSAVLVATHSTHRLFEPEKTLPSWTLILLGLSFVAKAVLAAVKFTAARRIRSTALKADALNDSADMLSAAVAAVAISLSLWDPQRFAFADAVGGMAVSVIIFIMGLSIFRQTSRELMDEMPDPALVRKVRDSASRVSGVRVVEKCFGRKSGTQFFFDLHIEVDSMMTVLAAHELSHHVKDAILSDCDFVKNVLVHVEPFMAHESSACALTDEHALAGDVSTFN